MITGTLKNQIDKIWDDMYSYGLANPLTVIDQLTSLFFIKSLDDKEIQNEWTDENLGTTTPRIFPQDDDGQIMRWSKFSILEAEEMHTILAEKVFPFIQNMQSPDAKQNDADGESGEQSKNAKAKNSGSSAFMVGN